MNSCDIIFIVQAPLLSEAVNPELSTILADLNPWWRGERSAKVKLIRRWAFDPVLKNLRQGLTPITVLRGPRQVGKTTLMEQVIDQMLDDGVPPNQIMRVQFDDLPPLRSTTPLLDLPRWFAQARLGTTLNQALSEGKELFFFFDEVQNLKDWATQLKHLVDVHPVRLLVTGSSALRIEAGRDSLAGRITTLELGPLLLREICEMRGEGSLKPFLPHNGLSPLKDKAFWRDLRSFGLTHSNLRGKGFHAFSERGAYPIAHSRSDAAWEEVANFLNETVVQRAIQHDLRIGERGKRRDPHLLEELFRLTCRYAGQFPSQAMYLEEVQQALNANIGWQRVFTYLRFLDGTLLVRLVDPLELRLKRRKGSPKILLCDHALRAAWLQEKVPLAPDALLQVPHLSDLAGRIAESVTGYAFVSIQNLGVAHFPERGAEPEVDFILTIGEQRIPVEVKYRRRLDYRDSLGLRAFIEKSAYNAPFGVLVTLSEEEGTDDPRIVSLPLSSLLMMR